MLDQWGWKIPFSKDTRKKSITQKILQKNLIQDISFFTVLKLSGSKGIVKLEFNTIFLTNIK